MTGGDKDGDRGLLVAFAAQLRKPPPPSFTSSQRVNSSTMSSAQQQTINIADLDLPSLQQVKTQLEEVHIHRQQVSRRSAHLLK